MEQTGQHPNEYRPLGDAMDLYDLESLPTFPGEIREVIVIGSFPPERNEAGHG